MIRSISLSDGWRKMHHITLCCDFPFILPALPSSLSLRSFIGLHRSSTWPAVFSSSNKFSPATNLRDADHDNNNDNAGERGQLNHNNNDDHDHYRQRRTRAWSQSRKCVDFTPVARSPIRRGPSGVHDGKPFFLASSPSSPHLRRARENASRSKRTEHSRRGHIPQLQRAVEMEREESSSSFRLDSVRVLLDFALDRIRSGKLPRMVIRGSSQTTVEEGQCQMVSLRWWNAKCLFSNGGSLDQSPAAWAVSFRFYYNTGFGIWWIDEKIPVPAQCRCYVRCRHLYAFAVWKAENDVKECTGNSSSSGNWRPVWEGRGESFDYSRGRMVHTIAWRKLNNDLMKGLRIACNIVGDVKW